ncbi:glycine/D-amino acid oxidase-like deaminating enzyme [Chitinophaga skermanii]|uniref:Glycine/D-amino acid oxidase-like deaminating enzyme n=1 Tax=Chitinophaga skermanii TaxID=331697 RepID=A0A327QH39_9BACT|nr:FAD-dependent oxidoreductase [Chitinophaga skermanii]RAJ02643.1 glycine/D-amino acid oxidase-like deaminating enzyme [Chitinophaga skermanii]
MDLKSGFPYSLIKNGLPYVYPALESDLKTSVIIVGAGISGALTAYALVQAGIPCVVLDGRTVGLGSTCASTSLLQYEIDVPLHKLIEKIGEKNAQQAYQQCKASIDQLEKICKTVHCAQFDRKESVYVASYKKDVGMLEKEFAARKAAGLKVEWWEEAQLQLHLQTDAPAAICSTDAAQTDAYMFTHALHQYNCKHGAQVYDRTKAEKIHTSRKGVEILTNKGYKVKAQYLVMATGYESVNYIREHIVQLLSTYAVISESNSHASVFDHYVVWETKEPYHYIRSAANNRILIGGRDEEFYNPTRRDRLIAQKSKQLVQDFQRKFPGETFIPEFSWTGTFGMTTDGLPYIGEYPRMARTFFALGFGGNGITFSQIAANIIAGTLSGKPLKNTEMYSFGR